MIKCRFCDKTMNLVYNSDRLEVQKCECGTYVEIEGGVAVFTAPSDAVSIMSTRSPVFERVGF